MKLNILLTENLKKTIPNNVSIDFNYGETKVIFPPTTSDDDIIVKVGDNVIINGENEEIAKWLKPFKTVVINKTDTPKFEKFELLKTKNLI